MPTRPPGGALTLSPASIVAGTAAPVTITVTGSNFVAGSSVLVAGTTHPAINVSPSTLTFALTAADLASPGSLSVVVSSPAPGGGLSPAATLTVTNPVPGSFTVTPTSLLVGASPALLTITGSGFEPGAKALVNGIARATTVLSTTQLTTQLLAADQASTGTLALTVVNPAPGGGSSPIAQVAVVNPTPGALTLTPVVRPPGRNRTAHRHGHRLRFRCDNDGAD